MANAYASDRSAAASSPGAISAGRVVRRNALWMFAGNVVLAASQWVAIMVIAKLGSANSLGRYTYALSVTAPVLLFAQLNLRMVQAVDVRQDHTFFDYFGLRILTSGGAALVLVCVALFTGADHEMALLFALIAAAKMLDGLSDVLYGALQQLERMGQLGGSMIFHAGGQIGLLGAAMMATRQVVLGAAGMFLGSLVSLLAYDSRIARQILVWRSERIPLDQGRLATGPRFFDWRAMWRLARLALPMGLMSVFGSLYQNIPRYFIQSALGYESVGYYSAMFYIVLAVSTAVLSLGGALAPSLARAFESDRKAFLRTTWRMSAFLALLGAASILGAALLGGRVLALLYRAEYANYGKLLVWMMVMGAVWYQASWFVWVNVAARRFAVQGPLHALTAILTAVFCAFLVPRQGLLGAVIALTIAVAVLVVAELFVMFRAVRQSPEGA